ncbi:PREDICTED: 60S ribosomal protein L28 [Nicrophorus vespilloides]|uniref:Large ribosomal subunit protein eL28 n=1 Tax=Nicrophorus vespilloides TaxID=110193 RepID=A0ABM1MGT9_NICVS|nr:PREDICTED: 60S ribosomal protein L28 [Nicrophorus vespilloides]XP_017773790.1 PREDICTED: 60S ribosomal protein L28 [Nicrophorus vespilloides]
MSTHLVWSIIRNNNAFLIKKRNITKPFSSEPQNLTNLHSYRYNGLIHKKTVGIVDAADKKGFTVVMKKPKKINKPRESLAKVTMKAGPRRSLHKLRRLMKFGKYRTDLTKAALRRASAILKSQKPIVNKKKQKQAKKPE